MLRERFNQQVLTKFRRVDPLDLVHAFDPARCFRKQIDHGTAAALVRDVRYVETIGGERLRREFELVFGEETASIALSGLDGDGALHAVHPRMSWDENCTHALASSELRGPAKAELGFALLARHASEADAASFVLRLRLKRDQAAAVMAMPHLGRMTDDKVEAMKVSKRYGKEYWDGARRYGYGGYRYDGRWKPLAERLIAEYRLPSEARILDATIVDGNVVADPQRDLLKMAVIERHHGHGGMGLGFIQGIGLQPIPAALGLAPL